MKRTLLAFVTGAALMMAAAPAAAQSTAVTQPAAQELSAMIERMPDMMGQI
jgi:hypothetical protein